MAARCSFLSTPVALPSVPSGIAQGPQIVSLLLSDDVDVRLLSCATQTSTIRVHIQNLHPTPIHIVEPEGLRSSFPVEEDFIGMDFLPNLRVTEHPIRSPPAGACPTGNYIASPPPFLEDTTTNALPPPSPVLLPTSSSSPSSFHDRIPRACHGVERRQRSRPSSRGGADYLHFSKLTRDERAAVKTASSRRVAFAEHAYQIASSSLWTSPDDAPPSTTVLATGTGTGTGTGKLMHRPPTPRYATSFDFACTSLDNDDERDASPGSPGFDADVEFGPQHGGPEQVDDKERLTIIVPGGKSEAYVSMAFERSCSLSAEDHDEDGGDDDGDDDCHASSVHQSHDMSEMNEKTGLKIRIPVPNPLFMLSLRLASSCRVSDEEFLGEATGNTYTADDDCIPSGMMQDHGHMERDFQNLNPLRVRVDRLASSRSPTPPVAPPPSPAPSDGRAERRVARRAALAPYCAIDRLHAVRATRVRTCFPC